MYYHRHQVRHAVTWKIIAELYRRYAKSKEWGVYEIRSDSGNDDLIALFEQHVIHPSHMRTTFSLNTEQMDYPYKAAQERIADANWPGGSYIAGFLSALDPKDFIDYVAYIMGIPDPLPKSLPPSTAEVVMVRLIAGLLERYMLRREAVQVRSIYRGLPEEPGYVWEEALKHFPSISSTIQVAINADPYQAGSRYWIVLQESPETKTKAKALIDMHGVIYISGKAPNQPWAVWDEYQASGRKLNLLVDRLQEIVG